MTQGRRGPDVPEEAIYPPQEPPQSAVDQPVQGYEYQIYYGGTESPHSETNLAKINELGAQGWRLTIANTGYYYFERPLNKTE